MTEFVPNTYSIGYWADKRDMAYGTKDGFTGQTYLNPVEDSATQDQTGIIAKLKAAYASGHTVNYRGWSTCRICDKHNGSSELEVIKGNMKYRIPVGYVHYLEDHNVAADPKLLEIL